MCIGEHLLDPGHRREFKRCVGPLRSLFWILCVDDDRVRMLQGPGPCTLGVCVGKRWLRRAADSIFVEIDVVEKHRMMLEPISAPRGHIDFEIDDLFKAAAYKTAGLCSVAPF